MKKLNLKYLIAGSVSLITSVVYLFSLQNDFVLWDDDHYVYNNPHIRSFNLNFLKWAFTTFHAANWHPLTWISHALDYAIWGLNPLGHHLTNIILHAVNAFIVVVLVLRLVEASKQESLPASGGATGDQGVQTGKPASSHYTPLIVAGVTGLLFGIHPIHVESVAWVAERKDLLCALFFLLSIMSYVKYAANIPQSAKRIAHRANNIYFAFTQRAVLFALCFFILALMSKPMAVSLPVVLLLLDWYPFGRIRSVKTFLGALTEKIPFIAFSLVSSVLTVLAQKSEGAMAMMEVVPLSARALVAAKALAAYLWKMLVPVNLVPYYPYPTPEEVTLSSPGYLLPVLVVAGITVASLAMAPRKKLLPALWGYYVATLLPVLGLVQVGDQAMADRYSYLPGIGPFLFAGLAVAWLLRKHLAEKRGLSYKVAAIVVCLLVIGFLSYRSVLQIGIWKNGITLWSYVIEKEPGRVPMAHINRGVVSMDKGDMEKAGDDFDRAIAINPLAYKAHNNRGLVFLAMKQYDKAMEAFREALDINPSYVDAYFNRGLAFTASGRPNEAIEDFNKAIALRPSDGDAYYRRGLVFLGTEEYDKAIEDFNRAIALNSAYYLVYTNLGVAYGKTGRVDEALQALSKSISLKPDNPSAYNNRAFTYYRMGRHEEALKDLDTLIQLDQNDAPSYINRGNLHIAMGRKELAVADFRKACDLGNAEGCSLLKR